MNLNLYSDICIENVWIILHSVDAGIHIKCMWRKPACAVMCIVVKFPRNQNIANIMFSQITYIFMFQSVTRVWKTMILKVPSSDKI